MSSSGKKSREKRKSIAGEKLKTALDIPEILTSNLPHIEAEGNREISVDGCRGILEYTQDKVRLNAGKLIITFVGDNMEIKAYSEIQTVISGNILSVEFESQGGGNADNKANTIFIGFCNLYRLRRLPRTLCKPLYHE